MKIWLINPYGPIPGEGWREYRFSFIARALAAEGHEVTWWTSAFSHHFKVMRAGTWEDRRMEGGYILRLVPTPGYSKNIGLGRIWRDWVFAVRVYRRGHREPAPDLVIFYESPLCLGFAGDRLARSVGSRTIFDQMDLWPEIIEQALPAWGRVMLSPLFGVIYRSRRAVYARLDGSIALATPYLKAMHRVAPVLEGRPHAVAYNGIDVGQFRKQMAGENDSLGLTKPAGELWAVFAGSLGETYDIIAMLDAAKLLEEAGSRIKIVIAGDGPLRREVEERAAGWPDGRVRYLGKIPAGELPGLYRRCDIGLCAYSARSNVEMPDKFYDYAAAGLAIVNSLTGEVAELVARHGIGRQYRAGDARDLAGRLVELERHDGLTDLRKKSFALGGSFDSFLQMQKVNQVVRAVAAAPRSQR